MEVSFLEEIGVFCFPASHRKTTKRKPLRPLRLERSGR